MDSPRLTLKSLQIQPVELAPRQPNRPFKLNRTDANIETVAHALANIRLSRRPVEIEFPITDVIQYGEPQPIEPLEAKYTFMAVVEERLRMSTSVREITLVGHFDFYPVEDGQLVTYAPMHLDYVIDVQSKPRPGSTGVPTSTWVVNSILAGVFHTKPEGELVIHNKVSAMLRYAEAIQSMPIEPGVSVHDTRQALKTHQRTLVPIEETVPELYLASAVNAVGLGLSRQHPDDQPERLFTVAADSRREAPVLSSFTMQNLDRCQFERSKTIFHRGPSSLEDLFSRTDADRTSIAVLEDAPKASERESKHSSVLYGIAQRVRAMLLSAGVYRAHFYVIPNEVDIKNVVFRYLDTSALVDSNYARVRLGSAINNLVASYIKDVPKGADLSVAFSIIGNITVWLGEETDTFSMVELAKASPVIDQDNHFSRDLAHYFNDITKTQQG